MSQSYFVARGKSLVLPVRNVRWTADPRSGRRIKTGETGGKLVGPAQLDQGFVDYAKAKKESNGQTLLQNLIDTGIVVFNQGDSSPLDIAPPPLPVERFIDPSTARQRS